MSLSDYEPINWVEKGAVTYVRDQGNCTADYAFATIGLIEGRDFIDNGMRNLRTFSDMQGVHCPSCCGCSKG